MKYIIAAIICLAILGTIYGLRCLYNRRELARLAESNWRKRIATDRQTRGSTDAGFLRCIVELGFLILMLAAVFGWLAHGTPH